MFVVSNGIATARMALTHVMSGISITGSSTRIKLTTFELVGGTVAGVCTAVARLNHAPEVIAITASRATAVLSHSIEPSAVTLSTARARLRDFDLGIMTVASTSTARAIVRDFDLGYGVSIGNSSCTASLITMVPNGLCGISFILSDRQVITQRPGLQGISMVLSDRQVITQRPGLQGISMVLSDQQPFNFNYGMEAVLIDPPTDEQWFEQQNGMEAVLLERDNITGRGYIIRK